MIKKAKTFFYENKLGSFTCGKKLWSNLREIGIGKVTNKFAADVDCDALNNNFTNALGHVDDNSLTSSSTSYYTTSVGSFNFTRISEEDVVESILSIKSNATGLDLMQPKFVKLLLPYLLQYITHIFNNIITFCEFPQQWKKAKIVPVPKKQNCGPTDFRPIAILPFLSKVFEKVILKQIHKYLTINNLLSSSQSGFRPQRSCKSALLYVSERIRLALDNDSIALLTLLDFSKAFDTVNHTILCKKLQNSFGFSSVSCKLLSTYLSGRQQCVVVNERYSSFLDVQSGVPQGSILGPTLFSLYINDLPAVVKHCSIHLYADDVQLIMSRSFAMKNEAVDLMNEDLMNISQWSKVNQLRLNPTKSITLPIYRKLFDISILSHIKLENEIIEYVATARNLGIIFNRTFTWNDHLNSVIGKVYGSLRVLQITARYVPTKIKILLAKTLLLPKLLYCCEVFSSIDSISRRKLNVIYNNIARFVFNLRRYDHVSSFSNLLSGCSLDNLIIFRSVSYFHKIIQTQQPDYLFALINFPNSSRSFVFILPRCKYLCCERQFFVHVVRLWNSLPIALRRVRCIRRFKLLLFEYLANN